MSNQPAKIERKKILQIMPADGWIAWYLTNGAELYWETLVCWALVEPMRKDLEALGDQDPTHWRYVVGIVTDSDGTTEIASDIDKFSRYEKVDNKGGTKE